MLKPWASFLILTVISQVARTAAPCAWIVTDPYVRSTDPRH